MGTKLLSLQNCLARVARLCELCLTLKLESFCLCWFFVFDSAVFDFATLYRLVRGQLIAHVTLFHIIGWQNMVCGFSSVCCYLFDDFVFSFCMTLFCTVLSRGSMTKFSLCMYFMNLIIFKRRKKIF